MESPAVAMDLQGPVVAFGLSKFAFKGRALGFTANTLERSIATSLGGFIETALGGATNVPATVGNTVVPKLWKTG